MPAALGGELAVSAKDALGAPVDATSLQIQGVLDDLYAYDGVLGATFDAHHVPTLRLWAPTAREVNVQLYADGDPATTPTAVAMTGDPNTGVWTATGDAAWYGRYYVYEVAVSVRATGRVERNWVTDPYSVSLSANSRERSQLISLDDPATAPSGWAELAKPPLFAASRTSPSTSSTSATSRPPTSGAGQPARHLRGLRPADLGRHDAPPGSGRRRADARPPAGLRLATVDEDQANWQAPAGDLASFPADSEEQQARVSAVADNDGFNWGYDPWHYTVPEGSYATDPDGPTRIVEFRQMVQSLAAAGLRAVMDVVSDHTTAAGQNARCGPRPDRPRLLPPPERRRQRRDVDLLPEHRQRIPHDGEAAPRLGGDLGPRLQGGRLPFRPHGPPHEA